MGLIPNLAEIPDLAPVEEGEYSIIIASAKEVVSKNTGRPGIQLNIKVQGEPNAETIFHTMWYPTAEDDKDKATTMWRMMKETLMAFGMPLEVEEVSEFVGKEANVILKQTEGDDNRVRNEIKRWL